MFFFILKWRESDRAEDASLCRLGNSSVLLNRFFIYLFISNILQLIFIHDGAQTDPKPVHWQKKKKNAFQVRFFYYRCSNEVMNFTLIYI